MNIIKQREELIEQLTESAGNLVTVVTIDAQEVQPIPGKAAIFIEPPEFEYEGWEITTATFKACVVAGTPETPVAALDVILEVLAKLHADGINMESAKPVTYMQGSESLAAYEITFNPLD